MLASASGCPLKLYSFQALPTLPRRDGAAMFVRSLILQLTFFLALMAASRLGTEALAAHAVVGQLWVTVSYAVDGFAAAGIVLGSRLAAQAHAPLLAPGAKR